MNRSTPQSRWFSRQDAQDHYRTTKRCCSIVRLFLGSLVLLLSLSTLGAEDSKPLIALPGEDLIIKVLIVGQGDPVYLWYGHAAIIVENIRTGRVTNYDYGVFDFRQDHFYRNFAMGRLIYGVMDTSLSSRIRQTQENRRNYTIYTLNIPDERRSALDLYLRTNVLPGNDSYLYHHYYDNCSTRIRDAIDFALEGAFKEWASTIPGKMSFRQHIHRFSGNHYIIDWGLSFLQGSTIDGQITLWDEMFLPQELEAAITSYTYTDSTGGIVPLVAGTDTKITYKDRPGIPDVREDIWYIPLVAGSLLGALLFILGRASGTGRRFADDLFSTRRGMLFLYRFYTLLNGLLLTPLGILGTVLLFMSLFTNHDVTFRNENLLLANPFTLWAGAHFLVAAFRKHPRRARDFGGLLMGILAWLGIL